LSYGKRKHSTPIAHSFAEKHLPHIRVGKQASKELKHIIMNDENRKRSLKTGGTATGFPDSTIGNSGNGGVPGLKCASMDHVTGKSDTIHYHLSWPPGTWDDVWVEE
jgi:hypothetical protein